MKEYKVTFCCTVEAEDEDDAIQTAFDQIKADNTGGWLDNADIEESNNELV